MSVKGLWIGLVGLGLWAYVMKFANRVTYAAAVEQRYRPNRGKDEESDDEKRKSRPIAYPRSGPKSLI